MKPYHVLAVDDERPILQALKRLLRKENFTLHTADSGQAALEFMESRPVHLVISDQRMPGMSGTELLQEIRKKHPDTIRVILSGYADAGSIIDAINKGEIYRFMAKPWNDEELKLTLRQCLEDYQLMEDTRNLAGEVENQNKQLDHLNQNLEQIIEKRTRDLKLCQEIFEHLPIPLVGIALEKIIVLVNRAFRGFFKNDPPVYPGVELNTLFSQQTIGHIEQALGGASAEPGTFEWNEKKVSYRLEPLVENGSPQGCLMMLETTPHE